MSNNPEYTGGARHELQAAFQTLAGRAARADLPGTPGSVGTPPKSSWYIPPHLLRQPALREPALHAHDWALQASRQQEDFDSVYHYGLALQELAARLSHSPADQLSLLQQASDACSGQAVADSGRRGNSEI